MTNRDESQTPQERAYDIGETSDAVGNDAPPTEQLYTSDPYEAYGRPPPNPTLVYPTYDPRYDPTAPPPNPTKAYPVYPQQVSPPPRSEAPRSEVRSPDDPGERTPRRGRWLVLASGALLLLLGVVAGYLLNGSGSSETTATAPTTRALPPTPAVPRPSLPRPSLPPSSEPGVPPLDQIPGGIGEAMGAAGSAVGTITANDGSTLTLDGIGGSAVTVHTTPQTRIMSLTGSKLADMRVGDTVLVQGDRVQNGAMTATVIIGTSIPDFGNFGN